MNLLDANDTLGQYPNSWYAASCNDDLNLYPLEHDIRAQICVIGAGYSGLSAALHLAQQGKDVCIIDAHLVGWGASGRNGGQLGSGQRLNQIELEELISRPAATSLWRLAQESKELTKSLIKKHKIKCEIKPGIIHANHRRRFNKYSKAEVELLNNEYGYDSVRYLGQEECQSLVASRSYVGGTYDRDAAHLHPLKYAVGLAKACINAGVKIYEQTRAICVEHADINIVSTTNGTITCDHLIYACNGYLGGLEKSVGQKVMPINNFIVATQPLEKKLATSLITNNAAVADSKFVVNYFRLSADRRLLFGGRESYGYEFPADIKKFVRKPMLCIFPQLRDINIEYGWGGTLAITRNRLPSFLNITPNVKSISGYSGHGVGMATLAGKLVAQAINGQPQDYELFQKIESKKFPGGEFMRSPLLVVGMLYHSLLDKF